MRRIAIACGGTGGHISPGIALLEELQVCKQEFQIESIALHSPKRNRDNPDLQDLDVEVIWHNLPQFKLKSAIWFPIIAIIQLVKTWISFRKRRINTVIGMGGYTSILSLMYAILSRSELFLCEQNCMPGKITRMFWKRAKKIALSFPLKDEPPLGVKWRTLGNPLRHSVIPKTPGLKIQNFSDRNPINVLVLGGSQGARQINQMVLNASENIDIQRYFKFRMLTGTNLYEEVKSKSSKVEAISYSMDMASHYEWADLVIGRSGAGVLAECSAYALPMILIPYPFAADNHQKENAKFFSEKNSAIIIDSTNTDPSQLVRILLDWQKNPDQLFEYSKSSLSLAKINASRETLNYFFKE